MNKDIILIGNGPSLLDKKNGEEIDSFNNVVRFNNYKIDSFESYVGKKTDIWFTVCCNPKHMESIHKYKEVYAHSWEWNKEKCKTYQKISQKRFCIKMERGFVRSNIPIDSPSTGLIAMFYFLSKYKKITITGFDWWSSNKHHYGDNEKRGSIHKPSEEYQVISALINNGLIDFL